MDILFNLLKVVWDRLLTRVSFSEKKKKSNYFVLKFNLFKKSLKLWILKINFSFFGDHFVIPPTSLPTN